LSKPATRGGGLSKPSDRSVIGVDSAYVAATTSSAVAAVCIPALIRMHYVCTQGSGVDVFGKFEQ